MCVTGGGVRAAYPVKPIRWILGYPPGGGVDFVARTIAPPLAVGLGQPVIIENRPGASTIVAAEAAAHSAPEGYTLLMADNGSFVFNTALYKKLPYDPAKDFIPVGMVIRTYMMLVTPPGSSARSLIELIATAKAQPGKLNNATNGSGTPHHMAMELLKQRASIDIVNIPFKGTAALLQELLAGRVDICRSVRDGIPSQSGQAACARGGLQAPTRRTARCTDIWGTPPSIVDRVSSELQKVLGSPETVKRLTDVGMEPASGTSAQMQQIVTADHALWVPLIRKLGRTENKVGSAPADCSPDEWEVRVALAAYYRLAHHFGW